MSPATFNYLQYLLYDLAAIDSVLCGNPLNARAAREFDDIVSEIQEMDQSFDLDSFFEKLI